MMSQQDNVLTTVIARDMFVTVQRLGLLDKTTSFDEFVTWMGELRWYAQIYKP